MFGPNPDKNSGGCGGVVLRFFQQGLIISNRYLYAIYPKYCNTCTPSLPSLYLSYNIRKKMILKGLTLENNEQSEVHFCLKYLESCWMSSKHCRPRSDAAFCSGMSVPNVKVIKVLQYSLAFVDRPCIYTSTEPLQISH